MQDKARLIFLLSILMFGIAASSAQSHSQSLTVTDQQSAGTSSAGSPATTADDNWHILIAPYLWFPGLHGTAGARGHNVSIHATPGDLLSNFDIGLMGGVAARKKRFLLSTDLVWVKMSADKSRPLTDLPAISAKAEVTEFLLTPKIGYRVLAQERAKIDATAGFRYWHLGQTFTFNPSSLGLNFSTSQNWADPLLGADIHLQLSPKTELTILGDAGGFGVGAQTDYQVVGALGYIINPKFTLQAGYRYLDVNYRSGTVIYDIANPGAILGVTINLK